MKKIAIYSLTRDRLDYTKLTFETLKMKAGLPFVHVVVDNGSEDGTVRWLRDEYRPFLLLPMKQNLGISKASNLALEAIFREIPDVDYIVKMDNDCRVITEDILPALVGCLESVGPLGPGFVLSPRVEGIKNQPHRARTTQLNGLEVGLTGIVGGLFHFVPARIYRDYRFPETLPYAWGQDDDFCRQVKRRGGEVGYVESLVVEHFETTDGQARRYPDYFTRKWKEEKQVPQ
jgi:GT2 family glycosyltransferase